jgi:hypothetical protein
VLKAASDWMQFEFESSFMSMARKLVSAIVEFNLDLL